MGIKGKLRDMTIADLIQHTCQDRKTARLKIQHHNQQATLYFMDGNVVHAALGDLAGEEVVYHILQWENGTFDLETGVKPPATTISHGWASLLMEGAQRIDEAQHEKETSKLSQLLSGKEKHMNIKRFSKIVEDLKEDLGAGLVATDSWRTTDAQSLAGLNSQPKAIALFNEITRSLNKSLRGAEFPGLGQYYMVNLEGNLVVVVVVQGDYQQGMLVDLSKTTLGMLISVALPKVIEGLAEAVK